MKITHYFLFAFLTVARIATAQTTDSLRTEQTTEDARISAIEVKRFIRYITRADVEERTLVKVGIWPASDRYEFFRQARVRLATTLGLSVEQKLSPGWSVLAGVHTNLHYLQSTAPDPLSPSSQNGVNVAIKTRGAEFVLETGVRHYYAQRRRITAGRGSNNFSGDYIGLHMRANAGGIYRGTFQNTTTGESFRIRSTNRSVKLAEPQFALVYGVQRRLGRFGYFDINAGPGYLLRSPTDGTLSFQLNALIGFGW
ncbi:MAG: hypothetical protein EAZ91_14685 [Cytophagales bacterium]|nr:MAG: hypothetical protein EAZ91_14685 [Cytophagales bacterium]